MTDGGLFKGTEVLLCKFIPGIQYRWNGINSAQEFSFNSLAIRLCILIRFLLSLGATEREKESKRERDVSCEEPHKQM